MATDSMNAVTVLDPSYASASIWTGVIAEGYTAQGSAYTRGFTAAIGAWTVPSLSWPSYGRAGFYEAST